MFVAFHFYAGDMTLPLLLLLLFAEPVQASAAAFALAAIVAPALAALEVLVQEVLVQVAAMHSISGASPPTDLASPPAPSAAAPKPAALDADQYPAAAAELLLLMTLVLLSTRVGVALMGDHQWQLESEQLVEQLMSGQSPTLRLSLQPCWRESMLQA